MRLRSKRREERARARSWFSSSREFEYKDVRKHFLFLSTSLPVRFSLGFDRFFLFFSSPIVQWVYMWMIETVQRISSQVTQFHRSKKTNLTNGLAQAHWRWLFQVMCMRHRQNTLCVMKQRVCVLWFCWFRLSKRTVKKYWKVQISWYERVCSPHSLSLCWFFWFYGWLCFSSWSSILC